MNHEVLTKIERSYMSLNSTPQNPFIWARLEDSLEPLQHISKGGSQSYYSVRKSIPMFFESSVPQILSALCDLPRTPLTCSCIDAAQHIVKLFVDVIQASQCEHIGEFTRCTSPVSPKCR
jgi:hypothetical protein